MPLIVGTNSWVTLAEANSYFADKWGAAASWAALSNAQKTQLLISAFRWLEGLSGYSIPPASTSARVKQAQCEAAWFLYRFNEEQEKRRALYAQGVRSFKVSEFSETLDSQQLPSNIAGLIEDFASGGCAIVKVSRSEAANSGDERSQR